MPGNYALGSDRYKAAECRLVIRLQWRSRTRRLILGQQVIFLLAVFCRGGKKNHVLQAWGMSPDVFDDHFVKTMAVGFSRIFQDEKGREDITRREAHIDYCGRYKPCSVEFH